MKRLRVLGDALLRGYKPPVLPFLAPATIPPSSLPHAILRPARPQHMLFARRLISSSPGSRASAAQATKEASFDSQPSTESPSSSEPLQPVDSQTEHLQNGRGRENVAEERSSKLLSAEQVSPSPISSTSDSTPVGEERSLLDSLVGGEPQNPLAENPREMKPLSDGFWARHEKPMKQEEYTSEKTVNREELEKQRALLNKLSDSAVQRSTGRNNAQKQHGPSDLLSRTSEAHLSSTSSLNSLSAKDGSTSPLRLDPYMGRSVLVKETLPLAQAIRRLDYKLRENRVKSDMMYQRFHERAGLKRKRLKRERWRRRFKEGFRAMVAQVQRMRKQGW